MPGPGNTFQAPHIAITIALAQAGAAVGLLPHGAAAAIAAVCASHGIETGQLARDAALAGTVVIPLVKWLKSAVPAHAKFVHFGGTSQDIIGTGLILQLRSSVALLQADLAKMADAAAGLAKNHATTPMAARTLCNLLYQTRLA